MPRYIEIDSALAELKAAVETEMDSFVYGLVLALTKSLPTADVHPVVHGRWEPCFDDRRREIEGDKCSACGFEHYGACINHYHYCPNCGAKMDADGKTEVKK